MKPFALIELIYELGFCNGLRYYTILLLLAFCMGIGMCLLVKQRRDCWALTLASLALYVLCELIIDFDISFLFGFAQIVGAIGLFFTLGFILCALVCVIVRMCKHKKV